MSIYTDDAYVERMTRDIIARGHRILQVHKMGPDDRLHVSALLALADFPKGAHVIDTGCGVGRVAEIMKETRSDLRFTLVNVSYSQLELAPPIGEKMLADFHRMPIADGGVDAVMFCYSLGHGRVDELLAEAARVLRAGGVLFIYDLTSWRPEEMRRRLDYTPCDRNVVCRIADQHGFSLTHEAEPETSAIDFIMLVGQAEYEASFGETSPIALRFVKGTC